MAIATGKQAGEIERRSYHPPAPYKLDVEIFSMSDLRRRVSDDHLRRAHRIDFHMLMCVTRGECTHTVDFKPILCRPGSLLVLQPSQVEQFDVERIWDAWLVLFRPEFLFMPLTPGTVSDLNPVAVLASLPEHLPLQEHEYRLVRSVASQMHEDSKADTPAAEVHALIRHQLWALLLRLNMVHRQQETHLNKSPAELHRFKRFQQLVEQRYAKWHQVADYARALGCTEKSLTRATVTAAGITAKAFIASRINLEAKRLLVHTSLSVTSIGDSVGFDDPSNFVKFFKRDAGCTPWEFRRRH
jgi:AraC-like DNA-binding protein